MNNFDVFLARLYRIMAGLVKHGDQCGPCRKVAQRISQELIAQALSQANMKVTQ